MAAYAPAPMKIPSRVERDAAEEELQAAQKALENASAALEKAKERYNTAVLHRNNITQRASELVNKHHEAVVKHVRDVLAEQENEQVAATREISRMTSSGFAEISCKQTILAYLTGAKIVIKIIQGDCQYDGGGTDDDSEPEDSEEVSQPDGITVHEFADLLLCGKMEHLVLNSPETFEVDVRSVYKCENESSALKDLVDALRDVVVPLCVAKNVECASRVAQNLGN
eukprot:jgi/Tetstr1/448447/TSEL_035715.t1